MSHQPAEKGKRKSPRQSKELLNRTARERTLVAESLRKWEAINESGRLLGRGLGKKELLDRVAMEVGMTLSQVHCALGLGLGARGPRPPRTIG